MPEDNNGMGPPAGAETQQDPTGNGQNNQNQQGGNFVDGANAVAGGIGAVADLVGNIMGNGGNNSGGNANNTPPPNTNQVQPSNTNNNQGNNTNTDKKPISPLVWGGGGVALLLVFLIIYNTGKGNGGKQTN
jgi:hypothetical protein